MNRLLIVILLIINTMCLLAQNMTNLPTSMYGLGELQTGSGGKYLGMGSIGLSISDKDYINLYNPAAVAGMDSTSWIFNTGATISFSEYAMHGEKNKSISGNPSLLALGTRLLPRWYSALSVSPYSSVGYYITKAEYVEGTEEEMVTSSFSGEGGLFKLSISNAFAINKNLSIGNNIGFISGSITQIEQQSESSIDKESSKKGLYVDFGFLYNKKFDKYKSLSLGGTYTLQTKFSQNNELYYYDSATDSEFGNYYDGIYYIPQQIGAGLTFKNKHWLISCDYNYINWKKNKTNDPNICFEKQHKINIGSLYKLKPEYPETTELLWGVGVSNSYLNIYNGKMYYLEASGGVNIPIRKSVISLGISWRKQINNKSYLMQENKLSLSLSLTFKEKRSISKIR